MKNSKLKFSEYMQNISRSKSFGKFVLIVKVLLSNLYTVIQGSDKNTNEICCDRG